MRLSSSILPKSITEDFTKATISRGHAYCNQYSIKSLQATSDDGINFVIKSEVFGSGKEAYSQSIFVDVNPQAKTLSSVLDAECSCPVSYFCKHIYAVLFIFNKSLAERLKEPDALTPVAATKSLSAQPTKKTKVPASNFDKTAFERQFHDNIRLEKSTLLSQGKAPSNLVIVYQLVAFKENQQLSYKIEASYVRILKSGAGYGKPQSTNLGNIVTGYAKYPDCADIKDLEIFKYLQTQVNRYVVHLPSLTGEYGAHFLKLLIATERFFIGDIIMGKHCTLAPNVKLDIDWSEVNGKFRFNAQINGKTNAKIIPTTPAFYIDGNKMGQIISDIPGNQLLLLNTLKDISKDDMSFVRYTIEKSTLAKQIKFPSEVKKLKTEKITPKAIAHFSKGSSIDWPHYGFFAEVSFEYDGTRFEPHESDTHIIEHNGRLIEKDLKFEKAKLETLAAFGFDKSRRAYFGYGNQTQKPFGESYILNANPYFSPEDQWETFYLEDLEDFKRLGWQVEFDDDFAHHYIVADNIDIGIEEGAQNDWFNVHLNVNHNGNTIDLQPLIMQYLQKGLNKEEHDLVAIVDKNHRLKIDYSIIEPVINSLFELNDERGDTLKFSKYQIGALMSLEEQLGKSGAIDYSKANALKRFVDSLKDTTNLPLLNTPKAVQATLRDYQRYGVSWMDFLSKHGMAGLLADDMGLGKTLQTLTWIQLQHDNDKDFGTSLIIAPTSVVGNWIREAEKFTPKLKILLLHGSERITHYDTLLNYDIVVTSYPLVLKDEKIHRSNNYSALILDEAQTIKNAKTKQAQSIFTLSAKYRFCLTGTPLENHLGELWSQFNFLMPGFLGNDSQFRKHFKNPIEKHQDTDRLNVLKSRISPFMLRRTKALVAKDLPEKTESIEIIELPNTQKQLYESVRMTMEKKVRELLKKQGLAKSHIHILDALLKLRQSCCHPQLVKLDSAKKVHESAKLDYLLEMLTELAAENRKVLVFSQFVEMLDLIALELSKHKIQYVQLTGQTKNRQKLIDDFSEKSDISVFLISLKAGGTGLNLVAADTVIHFDPWWNPAVEAQATDRAYRIGQDKPVTVYKLIAKDSVEEKILKLQQKKADLASGLYNKDGQTDFKLSENDLLNLFEPII
ncbi:DEAD/DEAH box helicase [Cysteiniphilum halobium]|uniref:DEAD/DEAH box helicase n=1 Tax=Cysteiniphilum halobium TaxID=2219059 RepID=UPI000E6575DD|nr:DEAD/DEAH box helicase [Cysteiniphilum halobium]